MFGGLHYDVDAAGGSIPCTAQIIIDGVPVPVLINGME